MDQSTAGYIFQGVMLVILVVAAIGFSTGGKLHWRDDRDLED